ncbi:helix-turn-helix protein [compost metagenome]
MNLSQERVAEEVGVSRQYYNYIENNKRKPSISLAKRLGSLLKIDWTIFFT